MPVWLIILNIGVLISLWVFTLFIISGANLGFKILEKYIKSFEKLKEEGWKSLERLEKKVVVQSQWEKSDVYATSKQIILELLDEDLIKRPKKKEKKQ